MFIFSQLPVRSYRPGPIWQPGRKGGFRRKEEEKPKASKHHSSIAPCQILRSGRMAKGIDYTVMEAKPSQLTRPQSTIASKHHSIKACILRSAGCKPQVAAGCWRLKADRSIKAPKPHSTKAISCLVPSDRISVENGRISGVPGPGISGRRSCRCTQR